MSSPCSANIFTTVICALPAGLVTLFNVRNITLSIINWMSTDLIMATLLGGTACSALLKMPTNLPHAAGSQKTTRKIWAICSYFMIVTKHPARSQCLRGLLEVHEAGHPLREEFNHESHLALPHRRDSVRDLRHRPHHRLLEICSTNARGPSRDERHEYSAAPTRRCTHVRSLL